MELVIIPCVWDFRTHIFHHYRSQLAPDSRWYPWWYLCTFAGVAWDCNSILVWVTWLSG